MSNKSFRARIATDSDDIIILPGVYDALTAKIAQDVGFQAAFQTGYGTSASLLGMPDFGFIDAGKTLENARRIKNFYKYKSNTFFTRIYICIVLMRIYNPDPGSFRSKTSVF